jgi:hypothetical protein
MTDEIPQGPSRRILLRNGLLAGLGTALVGVAAPALTGTGTGTARAAVPGSGFQDSWSWCDKCQGLFYGLFQSSSWCPAGGRHDGSQSLNYGVSIPEPIYLQGTRQSPV